MLVLRSLFSVQHVMINDRHCFELYGYDVMIDDTLKPWLIEVNASPSLTANTKEDYDLKCEMLNDLLDVVDVEGQLRGDEDHIGGFDLIYDNGYVDMDPTDAGWSTYLGALVGASKKSNRNKMALSGTSSTNTAPAEQPPHQGDAPAQRRRDVRPTSSSRRRT